MAKEKYKSKSGFVEIPLIRGFDLIRPLWEDLEQVKAKTEKDCFICGGYARWCGSPRRVPEPAGDLDIYSLDDAVFQEVQKVVESRDMEKKHENDISITYKPKDDSRYQYMPDIQLIKPMREARIVANGTKEEVLGNFDFTIVRVAILSPTLLLADADFAHDEKHKILRLKNIHCPVSSTLRCMKYSRKGYYLTPFEALKLFIDWQDRPEEYRIKLLDFLHKAGEGEGLSKEQVEDLEAMMRID